MPIINIKVRVDEGDEFVDVLHSTGLTNAGFERLTGISEQHEPSLAWLGQVEDVEFEDGD